VPTDLNKMFLGTEEGRAQTALWIPLGRVGAVEDVAAAAVFLASDEASWNSGAVLRVDGGMVVQ
jgi:NAD(P)-dependent dehydrogenase (short-subunit alcohol dehydrogenase family)